MGSKSVKLQKAHKGKVKLINTQATPTAHTLIVS